jgi:hypothetical protein
LHLVQDMDGGANLGGATPVLAEAQPIADHLLVGRNLYGAFGVKRISSCASLISLGLNRARSRAVARLQ